MNNIPQNSIKDQRDSSTRKKILIVAFRLTLGKRVLRQLYAFREKYDVYAVGFEPEPHIEGIRYFQVTPRFKSMNIYEKVMLVFLLGCRHFHLAYPRMYGYENILRELSNITFDLLLVHDIKPLPFVAQLHQPCEVLIDVHDYFFDIGDNLCSPLKEPLRYFMNILLRTFDNYLIKQHFIHYTHFFTTGQKYADEYYKKMGKVFSVITSAHDYVELSPTPVEETIRIIHHGHAFSKRKIEVMIEVMDEVDQRFELDLMLITHLTESAYIRKLQKMADERANVRIIPPVMPDELVTYTNQYDIGLFLLPETNLSLKYTLPNKFFEFIQARLCIAIGPTIEMANIVTQYDLGVVADDFQPKTLAQQLNALTSEQIMYYKQQCHRYARELSSETEMEKLGKMIETLL